MLGKGVTDLIFSPHCIYSSGEMSLKWMLGRGVTDLIFPPHWIYSSWEKEWGVFEMDAGEGRGSSEVSIFISPPCHPSR